MPLTAERLRSRHPFELFMVGASAFYSGAGLVDATVQPNTVQSSLGDHGVVVWLSFVFFGSMATLIGIALRDRATGLYAEQVGLLAAGAATMFYAAVVLYEAGLTATASASVLIGFGGACLVRSWQLHRTLTRVRKQHGGDIKGD